MSRLKAYTLLTLLALPALWPFLESSLVEPGLPRTNDNLTHLYRTVALDSALRGGALYPRWAPDLVHGYGYPVFDLFTPIPHYFAELFHLAGLNFLAAYKVASILALLFAAWFAWELGCDLLGERAGLVVGVIYLYSPYLLYDSHIRGSLPETLALGVLPLTFLFLRRAARGDRRAVLPAALSFAAFLLAHHGVTLQTSPLLAAWGLYHALDSAWPQLRQRESRFIVHRSSFIVLHSSFVVLPFLLGLLLSAFFWLPALTESQFAQTWRGTNSAAMDYTLNFFPARDFLRWPRLPVDPALLNPPLARSLPHLALLATLLLPLAWRKLSPRVRRDALFLLIAGAAFFFLMLPPARPLWDYLPLLRLTLFPWRLLGPLSLLLALLAATTLTNLTTLTHLQSPITNYQLPITNSFLPLSLLLFPLAAFPWTYPPLEPVPDAPTLADVAAFEIPPVFIGTNTMGEYLPVWVEQLPDTHVQQAELLAGRNPDRLDRAALPPALTADLVERKSLRWTYRINAPEAASLTFRHFYFPGWTAALDGAPLPLQVTHPHGLMRVQVPPGEHTLVLRFGTTPIRTLATLLSALAALTLVGLHLRARTISASPATRPPGHPTSLLPPSLFLLPLLLLALKLLLIDPGHTPLLRHQLDEGGLTGVAHPLNENVAGEFRLLGWEASTESFGADDSFVFTVYWTPQHPIGIPYGFKLELVDPAGAVWSHAETPRPDHWRFIPGTDFWPVGQYILDPYVITPLTGTPPGDYAMRVTVFSLLDLQPVFTTTLGPLTISRPSYLPPDPAYRLLAPALSLAEFTPDRTEAAPGDPVGLSILWRASGRLAGGEVIPLTLQDSRGQAAFEQGLAVGGRSPAEKWEPDVGMRDQLVVVLPASLGSGDYTWVLGDLEVGLLHVAAPERTFNPPPVAVPLNARLGDVTLVGATVSPPDVTLVWTTEAELPVSFRVFLHALDREGNLVAQSDGVPAAWTRPTTGWLPGEYITDLRRLDLSPGNYALFAGLYDPATGERLTSPEVPDGRVPLGEVSLAP